MATGNQLGLEERSGGQTGPLSHPLPADWLEHPSWFRFYFDDDRWTWSPQIEQMHGYKPGTTAPSTLLLLSHIHLDDYKNVAATLRDARRTHQPFSSRHRIVDTRDHVHDVVLIGAPFHDARGTIAGAQGLYLDLLSRVWPATRPAAPAAPASAVAAWRGRVRGSADRR
ncbi:MAG: PAS domain-containing protein [Mycobacterium sp.]|nr:PAS domain-containing protein [Mycobacterium sp.]